MTTNTRTEARLPEILEELYLGRTPDYRDEVVAAAVQTRQRPWWTFPGRWVPMADIASRPAYAPRLPWRMITVAFLIGALLLAATVAFIGSRQARVPLPFGLADNGLITYAADGDIWTVDPVTGITTAVVVSAEAESQPAFSPDGTRLAFRREVRIDGADAEEIVVVNADGTNPVVISRELANKTPTSLQWMPDSRSLLAESYDYSIHVLDATGVEAPRIVATKAAPYLRPFQPPDGDAILVRRDSTVDSTMVRIDLDTGKETVLATGSRDGLTDAGWSPDGLRIVFSSVPDNDPDSRRLFLMNADGTGKRQITSEPGAWWDLAAVWSPDGTRIAFLPYERIGRDPDEWDVRQLRVYSVANEEITDLGPLPREIRAANPAPNDNLASAGEGWSFDWAPDGKSLVAFPTEASGYAVVMDAETGEATTIDAVLAPITASQAWQRIAR